MCKYYYNIQYTQLILFCMNLFQTMFSVIVWFLFGFFIISDASSNTSLNDGTQNVLTPKESHETIKDIIYRGLITYEEEQKIDPLFKYVIKQLLSRKVFGKPIVSEPSLRTLPKTGICTVCTTAAKYLLIRVYAGYKRDLLVKILIAMCYLLEIENKSVCTGLIESNIDILSYIAKRKKTLNLKKICSIIFQDYGCYKDYRPQWSVYVPAGNSPKRFDDDHQSSDRKIKILQLTDIHIDPLYAQRALANCDEVICCQRDRGNATIPENAAGKWGDYRKCDMPYYSFVNALNQIIKRKQLQPKVSYVYFTGDIISHRIWSTSKEHNTKLFKMIYKLLKNKFGSIPIYPILGNHEPHPANVFSPNFVTDDALSTQWLFEEAVEEWSRWLPKETHDTIRRGGYYTVLAKPGFRIIALNSNVCFIYNWWLLHDNRDPYEQLQWLSIVLMEAEYKNESVHILSHIPPGDNTCLQEWSRQFHKIVERFANTITGQFNGHTHFVEWRVFYNSTNSSQAINVAYNGGSFTTFNNLNPNYRFYDVDSETYEVLNYKDWTYKVDEANTRPRVDPNWHQFSSFKDDYQVKSLKPKDVGDLVSRMAKNASLIQEYYRFKNREATPAMDAGCDEQCIEANWCSIVITEVGTSNYSKCKPFL